MKYIFYLITLVLLVCWVIGFYGYNFGGTIHVLLILSFLLLLYELIKKRNALRINKQMKAIEALKKAGTIPAEIKSL